MTGFDPDRTAAALLDLRRQRARVTPLGHGLAPRTEEEAAAAQSALARRMGVDSPGGFKIGATARRMQEYLGLSGPAAGFMPANGLHASGAALRYVDFSHPGVECEIAVRLARDLTAGCTSQQAGNAVGDLIAAIELVENRYGDLAELGTPTLIADQVFHAAAVLGAPLQSGWRGLEVSRLAGQISVDGAIAGEGVGADLLGDPMRCLAWLAGSSVAAAFGGLRAGQVVLLGSVTPPIWLQGPAMVEVTFSPLPPVALRLT